MFGNLSVTSRNASELTQLCVVWLPAPMRIVLRCEIIGFFRPVASMSLLILTVNCQLTEKVSVTQLISVMHNTTQLQPLSRNTTQSPVSVKQHSFFQAPLSVTQHNFSIFSECYTTRLISQSPVSVTQHN